MVKNSSHNIDLIIEYDWWNRLAEANVADCINVLNKVCDYLQAQKISAKVDFVALGKPLSLTLVLSNSEEVRKLNCEFRGIDKATNVLSFANVDGDDFADVTANSDYVELGDIIMSGEVLQNEAEIKSIPPQNHFIHLLVHGILHLLGFDHQTDAEADFMEAIETAVLADMNIDNPYKE